MKKALALKYGEELARAKAVASKEIGKRKREQDHLGVSLHVFKLCTTRFDEKLGSGEISGQQEKQLKSFVGIFLIVFHRQNIHHLKRNPVQSLYFCARGMSLTDK